MSPFNQIADLDRKKWIVVPYEFRNGKGKYSLEVDPARLSHCPAVEKVEKELGINYKNTAKDSFGKGFVGDKSWFDLLKLNLALGNSSLSLRDYNDYLRLLSLGSQEKVKVYDVSEKQIDSNLCEQYFLDIIGLKDPYRGEMLDAYFQCKFSKGAIKDYVWKSKRDRVRNVKWHIGYNHILDKKGNLVPQKSEVLDKKNILRENKYVSSLNNYHYYNSLEEWLEYSKTTGISLDDWLNNSTKQGLPRKDISSGNLQYHSPTDYSYKYPKEDEFDHGVASFFTDSKSINLCCQGDPSLSGRIIGIRACYRNKKG